MKPANFLTSSCRYCRYFQTEGRRGGMCQQLNVPVKSDWKACILGTHPFKMPWEHCEEVAQLEKSYNLPYPDKKETSVSQLEEVEETVRA